MIKKINSLSKKILFKNVLNEIISNYNDEIVNVNENYLIEIEEIENYHGNIKGYIIYHLR